MPRRPRIASILLAGLVRASEATRHTLWWLMGSSALMIALQVWDVWGRWGPAAIAELLSVLAAVAGVVLLGLVSVIGTGSAALSPSEDEDLRPVLIALPLVAFAGGILISAAIAFMIARGLLGIHQLRVVGVSAFLLLGLLGTWVTIRDTTQLLFDHAERRGQQAAQARAELADARVAALQARMQPHFLFNALNTIAELIRTDPRAAESTVEDLSSILRASLQHGDAPARPLRSELAIVQSLVGVEQRRFGPRLAVTWDVAPDTLDMVIPVLSLQPLVENAIKHGIAARIDGGTVVVSTRRDAGALRVSVRDDGDGFPARWTEGTGLGNLRARLRSLYGDRASLSVEPGPGARITMQIPAKTSS